MIEAWMIGYRLVGELLQHRINGFRTRVLAEILPNERFDFLAARRE